MKLGLNVPVVVLVLLGVVSCGKGSGTQNQNPVSPAIATQPASVTVAVSATANFTVVATGTAPLSYQWQNAATNANISGATSATYSISSATLAESGMSFKVVVSNAAGSTTSNAATLTVTSGQPPPPSNVTVLTYHNDISRTGLNPNETILTTSNVNSTSFGAIGFMTVDGLVDAEPLYAGNRTVNGATHNVLFVATENDSVYAFDADTFSQLWQVSVLGTGETASDNRGCDQVRPTIGITSTPVIDLSFGAHGAIFVVAMSKAGSTYHHRLHALDLATGADLMTATDIQATAPGTGTGSSGGVQTFNPASYEERTALLLLNGAIYTAWTSHCDAANYTSWVMNFSESNLQKLSVLNLTANGATQGGEEGGIWMAGSGPAADSSGNIYFLVGNGTFDTTLNGSGFPNQGDYGNAFMKLSTTGNVLAVADYFTMHNACCGSASESTNDLDLGSGGAMVLPDLTDAQGNTRHLAVGAGKDQNIYIVNRDNMGKFSATNDSAIYQELTGMLDGEVFSAPAYFNNAIYYGAVDDNLKSITISNARLGTSASSSSAGTFGYPGTTSSISANGIANGIVWAVANGASTGTLHAYEASNLSELFNGTFATNTADKFVTPMIANGKVYVGTPTGVAVFGLLGGSTRLQRGPAEHDRHSIQMPRRPPRPGSSTPGH